MRPMSTVHLVRIRCGEWLDSPYDRTCRRILAHADLDEQEGEWDIFFRGNPPSERGEKELAKYSTGPRNNWSRPHIRVIDRTNVSEELYCKCGVYHVLEFDKISRVLFKRWTKERVPIDILTTELVTTLPNRFRGIRVY